MAESGTEAYDPLAAARQDFHLLVTGLNKVSDQLAKLTETLERQAEAVNTQLDVKEQVVLAKQIASEVAQLKSTANELYKRGQDQEPDLAFSAAAQTNSLKSDFKYARKRFSATSAWNEIWETLKTAIPKLWNLISRLVKVKEWSVTGQIGGGPLGLAQAGISVTFGK